MLRPLSISSFPKAIVHIDGDAFFASCEQMLHPSLRGRPVVTGLERGIASSMSYEAKARGVTRGLPIHEIRRVCPEAIILPSDYETYGLFSLRMYEIVRRYTEIVEEYSIDECFAEITGLRRPLKKSYSAIAEAMKHDLDTELGVTFSVGLAPTKVLAKVASKWQKPSGLTIIPARKAHHFLNTLPAEKLWGVGPNTASYFRQCGIRTALDFAYKNITWVEAHLTKPHVKMWYELHGVSVLPVDARPKSVYKSISKTRTFTPASADKELVFSQLSKNVEGACAKARRYRLATRHLFAFIKTAEYAFRGIELTLSKPTNTPGLMLRALRTAFERVYLPGTRYRATGIFLLKLEPAALQPDLFGEVLQIERMREVHERIDTLVEKYGRQTVFLGSSLLALEKGLHQNARGMLSYRKLHPLKGEGRKRLAIPYIGEVV